MVKIMSYRYLYEHGEKLGEDGPKVSPGRQAHRKGLGSKVNDSYRSPRMKSAE